MRAIQRFYSRMAQRTQRYDKRTRQPPRQNFGELYMVPMIDRRLDSSHRTVFQTGMLKILGKASSINVRKVLWTCAELNLSFEQEDWGSGFKSTQTPAFLTLNPNGLVPVLRDGDFVLWESNSIIRYLASRYNGSHLYPTDPMVRAGIDQWMDWQATELNRSWSYAFLNLVRQSTTHQAADETTRSIETWTRHMRILNGQLTATGAYIAGTRFSLADIPIALSVNRWFGTPFDRPHFAAVSHYFDRLNDRPAFLDYCKNGLP